MVSESWEAIGGDMIVFWHLQHAWEIQNNMGNVLLKLEAITP